jgi:hypothetical protein
MLKGAAIGGGTLGLLSFSQIFGLKSAFANHDAMDDVQTIANLAATAETLAATSYFGTIAFAGDLGYSDADVAYFKLAMDSELYHLEVLQSLGGTALAQEFYIPAAFLSDKNTNVQTFIAAETAFTGAYLAATRRFAELGQPRLAATTAQHAATEAEHLALTRITGGLVPNPNALPAPIYYNVSDAVPTLLPFLQGGEGFIGPVAFPGVDAIRAALGGVESQRLPTFLGVF